MHDPLPAHSHDAHALGDLDASATTRRGDYRAATRAPGMRQRMDVAGYAPAIRQVAGGYVENMVRVQPSVTSGSASANGPSASSRKGANLNSRSIRA